MKENNFIKKAADIACYALIALFGLLGLFALGAVISQGPTQPALADSPDATPSPCPHCIGTPIPPNTPLNDLGQNFYAPNLTATPVQGGLYPGGYNNRPPDHDTQGRNIAQTNIFPRNFAGGRDDANGAIVMISIGMCNTTKEFGGALGIGTQYGFEGRTMGDPAGTPLPWKNPKLVVIDCAQSGQDGKAWSLNTPPPATPTPSCTPGPQCTPNPWLECFERLLSPSPYSGTYSTKQVQVVWLKEALASPETDYGPWPIHANALKGYLDDILDKTASFFPNVQMVFFSPRTRAWTLNGPGFDHSPEPDAYETGFADKWVIQEQLEGRTGWPWLSWGPYIWTDGLNPRSDTLTWPCSDVVNDCVHPTVAGVTTVVDQLLAFFRTDPVATPWFLRAPDLNAPTITASPTSATITVGGHVDFRASATAYAGRTITEYMWTFDDGDYAYMTKKPRKYFYAPSQVVDGISYPYQVHFTVIDNTGSTAFATIPVTVTTPTPGPRHNSPEHAKHR